MFWKTLLGPVKLTLYFIVGLLCIWLVFFAVYLFVPERATDAIGEEFTFALSDLYSPVVETMERRTRRREFDPAFMAFSETVINIQDLICLLRNQNVELTGSIQLSAATLSQRIMVEKERARHEMVTLQGRSTSFALLIIFLGLLTTVSAGLNSSEFAQSGRKHAGLIKVAAVIFPAAVTAVTAASSLLAGQDQITKQTQIHYGLVLLASEINSQMMVLPCPASPETITSFSASLAEWNRRVTDIVAGANMTTTKPAMKVEGADGRTE